MAVGAVALAVAAACSHSTSPAPALWVTAYYPAYATDTALGVADVPYGSATHVVHFSLVPNADGTLSDPYGLVAQSAAFVAGAHAAGSKALLGVGGDSGSGATAAFQAAAAPGTRAALVANIVAAMNAGGYDGVDLNWESVRLPDDVANLQGLITATRAALDAAGGTHRVFAYPAGTASDFTQYGALAAALAPVQSSLDQLNLQTYVMAGPFPGWVTWFNSPLRSGNCVFPGGGAPPSIDSTVQAFLAAGIAPAKLGIGLQLAAVDWKGGSGTTTGGVTSPCQSWDMSSSAPDGQDVGAPDYSQVVFDSAAYGIRNFTGVNGFTAHQDAASSVPWLSLDSAGNLNDHFVSTEDAASIAAKADFARAQGLGGTIVFDITGDYLSEKPAGDAQHPLMTAVRSAFLGK
ncbi:MAG TPA: glycoside hydrolase family 18 protein [bacterium]|nr:glycoside hydrolase family 18 protein [bacterium]